MGRWPLLVARQLEQTNPVKNASAVAQWQTEIVSALAPTISTLSTKIDGLSWQ
jgi:hypothetical protein